MVLRGRHKIVVRNLLHQVTNDFQLATTTGTGSQVQRCAPAIVHSRNVDPALHQVLNNFQFAIFASTMQWSFAATVHGINVGTPLRQVLNNVESRKCHDG
jgi:hypothetical protein